MADDKARVERPARPVVGGQDSQTKLRAVRRFAYPLHEVVVTGIGVVLPQCDTRQDFWRQLREGESQLAFEQPDPADQRKCAVGRVGNFDAPKYLGALTESHYAHCHREPLFYLASLVNACRDADL